MRRHHRYIDEFLAAGCELTAKQKERLSVIDKYLEQQEYMHKNNVHSVPGRIVSIDQPYIRLIVRGKVTAPTEFGAKMDLSLDENGMARLEKMSYEDLRIESQYQKKRRCVVFDCEYIIQDNHVTQS